MKKLLSIFAIFFILANDCYSGASQKLIVILDWFANPNHAPLFVAQQKGYFKEQGLEVELLGPADPADPPKLVAAGKADIAITYEPLFIEQINQGLPLMWVGNLIDKPLDCMVVLKNGPIHSISDLKGKRIGYSSDGISSLSLATLLKNNGLNPQDVKLVNVHYNLSQALLSQQVDAVIGIMRNFELIQMELAGHPGRAFLPEENGVPHYNELIFIANKKNNHDPKFSRFLIALKKGIVYLQHHPNDTFLEFTKIHPELNDELGRKTWLTTLPYFTASPEKFDTKRWNDFEKFMLKNGLINKIQLPEIYNKE